MEIENIPDGDVLIHSGDVSVKGTQGEIETFLDWYNNLPHKHKIFISGNHDFFFDTNWSAITEIGSIRHKPDIKSEEYVKSVLEKYPTVTYLKDSGVEIDGIKFWGSPITPWFHDWAFNRPRGEDIQKHWDMIPKDTNVLITHGPVYKILDKIYNGDDVGCKNLQETLQSITELKLHTCGHIHEAYGTVDINNVKHINAAICNFKNTLNAPIIFDLGY
jgi:Icc-related predicted phosphoesterase